MRPAGSLRAVEATRWLIVFVVFALLAVAHTWPLARDAATRQFASPDVTTGVWSLIGISTQLSTEPTRLFDGHNLYPADRTLAVVDHQLGATPVAVPVLALGGSGMLAFNLAILASFALSGVTMTVLVRKLSGSMAAGILAGCAFAWSAYRVNEIQHPHALITQWVPLALLSLHLFVEQPRARRWVLLALGALAVALSSLHLAQLGGIGLALVAVLLLLGRDGTDRPRAIAGIAAAGGLALLVLAPIAALYAEVASRWPPLTGGGRETLGTLAGMSLRPADLLAPPAGSTAPYAGMLASPEWVGAFPGFVLLALAVWALKPAWHSVRPLRRIERVALAVAALAAALLVAGGLAAVAGAGSFAATLGTVSPVVVLTAAGAVLLASLVGRTHAGAGRNAVVYAALAAAGVLLALGPRLIVAGVDLGSGVARYDLLPIPLMIRSPARFFLLANLGLAVLAGLGLADLMRRTSGSARAALVAIVLVAVNVEAGFTVPPSLPVPPIAAVDRWLRAEPEPGAVIEYPLLEENFWTVYRSYAYGRRTVAGAGYLLPPALRELEAADDLSAEQLDLLWTYFRPRFVVVRLADYPAHRRARVERAIEAAGPALVPRFADGDDRVYELVDRGRGPSLVREWPGSSLRQGPPVIGFLGRVSADPPGTIPELTVLLNGVPLWSGHGVDLERWRERWIEYDPTVLADGANRFELRSDYILTADDPPRRVGETGATIAADIAVSAERGRALIEVNGRQLYGGYGYFVVVLDPETGKVKNAASFDTFGSDAASRGLAYFIELIPQGTPVVVASRYNAGARLGADAVRALRGLGGAVDLRDHPGAQHAIVGIRGAAPGTALEQVAAERAVVELGTIRRRRVQLRWLELGARSVSPEAAPARESTMGQPNPDEGDRQHQGTGPTG